jgi:DnaJ-class molecular chaperone
LIKEAYEVLSNPEMKILYDNFINNYKAAKEPIIGK